MAREHCVALASGTRLVDPARRAEGAPVAPPGGKFVRYLERFLEYIVLLLITGLAVLVVVAVGFRKAGAALVWYDELASIMLAWLTYYGACLAAVKHAHIGFPKLVEGASPKVRASLIVVREVLVVGFFLAVAWSGWLVHQVLSDTYLVSMPSIPTGLAHSVIPLAALLFVVAELSTMPRRLATVGAGHAAASGHPGGNSGGPPPDDDGGDPPPTGRDDP